MSQVAQPEKFLGQVYAKLGWLVRNGIKNLTKKSNVKHVGYSVLDLWVVKTDK